MGVLGLTPFLLKSFPEVVKQLPDRLRGLAGKRIVIDGTLITQRLHFAQVPHDYRHVLGWYRLVKELQESGVSAICVFDGQQRSVAKAREAERRRDVQKLAVARGSIELARVKRLHRLSDVLHHFQALDIVQKERVARLFEQISAEPDRLADSILVESIEPSFSVAPERLQSDEKPEFAYGMDPGVSLDQEQDISWNELTLSADKDLLASVSEADPYTQPSKSIDISNFDDSPASVPDSQTTPSTHSPAPLHPPLASSSAYDQSLPPLDRPFPGALAEDPSDPVPPITLEAIPDTLASLYLDFRQSIRKLAALTPLASAASDSQPTTDTEQQEIREEYTMTKSQIQLTADEAKLWEEIASPSPVPQPPDSQSPEDTLSSLSYRATLMSQSYERRTNPPTTQTYDECKEVIRAMGIPCMDTGGTYEAEALASSIVLHGFADYVASEDTDVIVYEAPLIRNLTNRSGPLMVLSGTEIRTVLQLDRSSFIDFALLLGTDFSQRIKNVGPTRALKFIRQHKSIERVIEMEKKYTPRIPAPAYLAEVEVARLVFQTLPPVPDIRLLEQPPDEEGLAVILQRFGLGKLLMSGEDWDSQEALEGNYFSDNPSAT
ncbi:PIN domain-like protein [Mycena rebaudengoi]|nr:PIN domain-like protein [Mycena rebaudengoi]